MGKGNWEEGAEGAGGGERGKEERGEYNHM